MGGDEPVLRQGGGCNVTTWKARAFPTEDDFVRDRREPQALLQ